MKICRKEGCRKPWEPESVLAMRIAILYAVLGLLADGYLAWRHGSLIP